MNYFGSLVHFRMNLIWKFAFWPADSLHKIDILRWSLAGLTISQKVIVPVMIFKGPKTFFKELIHGLVHVFHCWNFLGWLQIYLHQNIMGIRKVKLLRALLCLNREWEPDQSSVKYFFLENIFFSPTQKLCCTNLLFEEYPSVHKSPWQQEWLLNHVQGSWRMDQK